MIVTFDEVAAAFADDFAFLTESFDDERGNVTGLPFPD
jgi:hypothetical protein